MLIFLVLPEYLWIQEYMCIQKERPEYGFQPFNIIRY